MLGLMIGYFLGKGKKLLTLSPDFSMYDYYASMHESEVVKFPCEQDGSFSIADFIEFGREHHVDMVLFSNPNNPTGHFVSNAQLCKIAEAFPRIPVIIDEAYGEFAKESMMAYLDTYHNLYVTRTLSKAYGFAGARLGFLISCPSNIAKLKPVLVPYNISSLTQRAGMIVLRHAAEYELLVEEIQLERDMLYHKLKQLKNVTFYPSQANYLYGKSKYKQELLKAMEKEGIVIRNYEGKDSFRITVGSPAENAIVLSVLQEFDRKAVTV
jgi:histidinol-phosphate aminotransferase